MYTENIFGEVEEDRMYLYWFFTQEEKVG
ncbi:hypothetical protein [Turicibacter bilis]